MTDDRTRHRALFAIFAVILLIGVGGVTLALTVGDDGPAGTTITTPGASADPLTPIGQCQSDTVATYEVTGAGKAEDLTATAAVEPWVRAGEDVTTTSTGDDAKLAVLGKPGKQPRSVLTVQRSGGAWAITATTACLDAGDDDTGDACAPDRLVVDDVAYVARVGGDAPAQGAVAGQGELTTCLADGSRSFAARGTIAPVTAYAVEGQSGQVSVTTDDGTQVLFGSAR